MNAFLGGTSGPMSRPGNIGCNSGIFNLDLLQDTGFRVQSCLPELCSIHFTKTFVALQGEIALVGLAVLLKGLIIIEVFLSALDGMALYSGGMAI